MLIPYDYRVGTSLALHRLALLIAWTPFFHLRCLRKIFLQLFRIVRYRQVGKLLKQDLQISARIQSVSFGCAHDAENNTTCLGAFETGGKEPVLAAHNEFLDGPLGTIIGDLQTVISQNGRQGVALVEGIVDGFAQFGLGQLAQVF